MGRVAVRSNRLRAVLILATLAGAGAACDDHKTAMVGSAALIGSPSSSFSIALTPDRLGITPFLGGGCSIFPSFVTRFDLLFQAGLVDLSMDQVSFSLISGSNLGGSSLVFMSRDLLTTRFGNLLIPAGSRRAFGFAPQFGCSPFVPRFFLADILLSDRFGTRFPRTIRVPFE